MRLAPFALACLCATSAFGASSSEAQASGTQSAGPPRYDFALAVQSYRRGALETDDGTERSHAVFGAGLTVGRYWSHRHRTEASLVATSRREGGGDYWVAFTVYPAWLSHDYRHELISLAHVVQLGRNRWFHPQIGLGATLDLEHRRSWLPFMLPEFADGFQFPSEPDLQRALAAHPSRTSAAIYPFGLAAVKLYLGRRAFLRVNATLSPIGKPSRWTLQGSLGRDW